MTLEYIANKFLSLIAQEMEKNINSPVPDTEVFLKINGKEYPIEDLLVQCKEGKVLKIIIKGESNE